MELREALLVTGLLLASVGLGGCGGEDEGETTGTACPPSSTLTYENFGRAFFEEHCLACHGSAGPQSPKLGTLALVRANASRIDALAAAGPNGVNTAMPRGASVATSEREKLGEWLSCGAPE